MADDSVVSGIIDAATLQQYVDVFTPLVHEARWHFNDDGIACSVVDPANVAMYKETSLDASAFEAYESPGAATLGLNLGRLDELIGPAHSDDLVSLSVNMETRHLEIAYRDVDHEMALIDPQSIRQEPGADQVAMDQQNHVVIGGEQFDEAISACALTAEHINVRGQVDGGEVLVFAVDGDTDSTTVAYDAEDCIRCDFADETESVFSLDYLEEFLKPIPDDAEVTLHVDEEWPMRLEWDACEGTVYAHALLAPRIQST